MRYETLDSETLQTIKALTDSNATWWVMTALRGPDFSGGAHHVKQMTTAVLRHFVGMTQAFNPSDVRTPDEAQKFWGRLTPLEREEIARAYEASLHFRYHFEAAMRYLGRDAECYLNWYHVEVTGLLMSQAKR